MNTSNYVYNKTVEAIYKDKHVPNFQSLRDKLVTANTKKNHPEYQEFSKKLEILYKNKQDTLNEYNEYRKKSNTIQEIITSYQNKVQSIKDKIKKENEELRIMRKKLLYEKNNAIQKWELNTPKEVRAGAVQDVCKAIKTGIANLKASNIRHFRLRYKKKIDGNKSVVIPKNFIKNNNGIIQLAPRFFNENCNFVMGKRNKKKYKDLIIENDCRIVLHRNEYMLIIPLSVEAKPKTKPVNYCGVDPGVRTFMTCFGNEGCIEYHYNEVKIKSLNDKIKILKNKEKRYKKRMKKRNIRKIEKRKENLINELHWNTIQGILNDNDFIFYGDIKSHDIVKNGINRTLNTNMNDLKLYKFKERLLFKAKQQSKKVYLVNERYTTQTCSYCGDNHKVGALKVYTCRMCNKRIGRDVNAAKNILMKGIMENIKDE